MAFSETAKKKDCVGSTLNVLYNELGEECHQASAGVGGCRQYAIEESPAELDLQACGETGVNNW
jgi:hypothetical protein